MDVKQVNTHMDHVCVDAEHVPEQCYLSWQCERSDWYAKQ